MTEKQSPPHTPYSLTVLNWHSFKSWGGPRAADSKTFGIRTQKMKGFVPFWLLASFLGPLCLPMPNAYPQCRGTSAEKPLVSWQAGKPRFPQLRRRKDWLKVVEAERQTGTKG